MRCCLLTELRVEDESVRTAHLRRPRRVKRLPILSASLCQHHNEALGARYCIRLTSGVARVFPLRGRSVSLDRRQHVVGDLLQDRKGDALERRPDMQAFEVARSGSAPTMEWVLVRTFSRRRSRVYRTRPKRSGFVPVDSKTLETPHSCPSWRFAPSTWSAARVRSLVRSRPVDFQASPVPPALQPARSQRRPL